MKKIIQDIIPKNSRSIRNIPTKNQLHHEDAGDFVYQESVAEYSPDIKRGKSKKLIVAVSFLFLVVAVYLISIIFAGAKVIVTPLEKKLDTSASINATTRNIGGLPVEIIEKALSKNKIVPAEFEKHIQKKASGTIVVYNNYSAKSQKLVKNTRFESPSGLIYKIPESISIPGQKVVNGKTFPGSIEVTVYAESFGPQYNIGRTDFSIPGFKGLPQYGKVYARSKTDMKGGFSGLSKVPSSTEIEKAKSELKSEIVAELVDSIRKELASDKVFFENAYHLDIEFSDEGDNVRADAKILAFIFKRDEIAMELAATVLREYNGGKVAIQNLESLQFDLMEKDNPMEDSKIAFKLSGTPHFVWQFDDSLLREKLAGRYSREVNSIASEFPNIKSLKAVIRPFWKTYFPKKADSIKIKIELDDNLQIS